MLKHEENARKVHEGAVGFRAETRLGKVIGWTFRVPRDSAKEYSTEGFSWVNLSGEATSDTYSTRHEAYGQLRAYLKMKRQEPPVRKSA